MRMLAVVSRRCGGCGDSSRPRCRPEGTNGRRRRRRRSSEGPTRRHSCRNRRRFGFHGGGGGGVTPRPPKLLLPSLFLVMMTVLIGFGVMTAAAFRTAPPDVEARRARTSTAAAASAFHRGASPSSSPSPSPSPSVPNAAAAGDHPQRPSREGGGEGRTGSSAARTAASRPKRRTSRALRQQLPALHPELEAWCQRCRRRYREDRSDDDAGNATTAELAGIVNDIMLSRNRESNKTVYSRKKDDLVRGDAGGNGTSAATMTPRLWLVALQVCAEAGRPVEARILLERMVMKLSPSSPAIRKSATTKRQRGRSGGGEEEPDRPYGSNSNNDKKSRRVHQYCRPNLRHYTAYLKAMSLSAAGAAAASEFYDDDAVQGGGASPAEDCHQPPPYPSVTDFVDESLRILDCMAGVEAAGDDRDGGGYMQLPPCPIDFVAVRTALATCASLANYAAARLVLDGLKEGRYGYQLRYPDERCYNLAIASCETPEHARDVLQEMRLSRRRRRGRVPPSALSYTRAIAVCRKCGDVDACKSLWDQAKRDGRPTPDVFMYSAAIWTAARAGDYEYAKALMRQLEDDDNCQPNAVSYNGLIAACLARNATSAVDGESGSEAETYSRNVQEAVAICIHMVAKAKDRRDVDLFPTRVTYRLLEKAFRSIKDQGERLELLTRTYIAIPQRQRTAGNAGPIIEALIGAYGALGMCDDALRVFGSIWGPADAPCLRAALFACSTAEPTPRWEEALSLLHCSDVVSGAESPARVDSVAVSYAMLSCSKAGQWEESLQLLRLYGSNRTSILALNSLIGACGRGKRPDMAVEVLNEMGEYGLEPDARSYRNAIIACNHAEHEKHWEMEHSESSSTTRMAEKEGMPLFEWWEYAVSLILRMRESGLEPDVQSYSSAISACEAAGQWQRALVILQTMLDDLDDEERDDAGGDSTTRLNLYCFNAAISACEKGGAWVEALEIYERMKDQGGKLRPNVVTLSSLILALDKAEQKELAQTVYEEGVRKKLISPWRTTRNSNGESIWALDLHTHSAALARAAIRAHVEYLVSICSPSSQSTPRSSIFPGRVGSCFVADSNCDDWVIIVGKGLRSERGGPVLLPTVLELLKEEYDMDASVDESNAGRVVVRSSTLRRFLQKHRH